MLRCVSHCVPKGTCKVFVAHTRSLPKMLKWRISSSRFFFNINKQKCLTFPPFPPAFRHVWKVVSIHHFPPSSPAPGNPPFPLGYPTLVPTSPPGGDWDQVVPQPGFLMSPEKENRRERRQVFKGSYISDWQKMIRLNWLKFLHNLQIPLGGVI